MALAAVATTYTTRKDERSSENYARRAPTRSHLFLALYREHVLVSAPKLKNLQSVSASHLTAQAATVAVPSSRPRSAVRSSTLSAAPEAGASESVAPVKSSRAGCPWWGWKAKMMKIHWLYKVKLVREWLQGTVYLIGAGSPWACEGGFGTL